MNVIPAEKNPISPEPIMPRPVEEETKDPMRTTCESRLDEFPTIDGLKAKCPICGGTNVHYKKGCLDCLKKKAIKKADEEDKEREESKKGLYEIRVENKLVGEITTTVDYLKKTYHTLNETGVFLFEDGTGSIIYLDQPKHLTVSLKPKKDPMAYKRMPNMTTATVEKKKWWKKNEKV